MNGGERAANLRVPTPNGTPGRDGCRWRDDDPAGRVVGSAGVRVDSAGDSSRPFARRVGSGSGGLHPGGLLATVGRSGPGLTGLQWRQRSRRESTERSRPSRRACQHSTPAPRRRARTYRSPTSIRAEEEAPAAPSPAPRRAQQQREPAPQPRATPRQASSQPTNNRSGSQHRAVTRSSDPPAPAVGPRSAPHRPTRSGTASSTSAPARRPPRLRSAAPGDLPTPAPNRQHAADAPCSSSGASRASNIPGSTAGTGGAKRGGVAAQAAVNRHRANSRHGSGQRTQVEPTFQRRLPLAHIAEPAHPSPE